MALPESKAPDFQDEFERKLLESSLLAQNKYQAGQISAHAYQEILEVINGIARGLCPETFCMWLDHERDIAGYHNDTDSVFMMAKENAPPVLVVRKLVSGEITVANCKTTPSFSKTSFDNEIVPSEEAAKQANKIEVALIKKGYRRVL